MNNEKNTKQMHDRGLPHNHGTRTAEIIKELDRKPGETVFEDAADAFSLLSDSSRLKIFWLICHTEDCVTNIAAAVEMSAPAVSHHLRILKQSGLIESHKEGKEVYYRLADKYEARLMHKAVDSVLGMKIPELCD